MHSIAISLLAAAATLSTSVRAAPTPNANPVEARAAYYVCNNNGFRGDCSVDPCAISWCPDYQPYTYEPVGTVTPPVTPAPAPTAKSFYTCFNNGFRGDCSVDPCALPWCPDYTPYTYTPIVAKRSDDPTVCAPGTGYFQSCSNGFRGCCKSDACGPAGWCPDYKFGSYTPIDKRQASDPTVCAPGTGFFQSCSNGFRGCCKSDACGPAGWCPDYKFGSYTPIAKRQTSDPTVCAPGTGFFQSCSNGFRGCCKSDACGPAGWCPDYKFGSYTPIAKRQTSDPTVCAPGTGFFQSCSNGFRGCCKSDACGPAGWCPDYKFGSYTPVGATTTTPSVVTPKVETPAAVVVVPGENGVCPPNTGFYQVCSNGFKGCCKKDACGSKTAVCPA